MTSGNMLGNNYNVNGDDDSESISSKTRRAGEPLMEILNQK